MDNMDKDREYVSALSIFDIAHAFIIIIKPAINSSNTYLIKPNSNRNLKCDESTTTYSEPDLLKVPTPIPLKKVVVYG